MQDIDVGRVLRQTRVRLRLTQVQVARAARVSQPAISRLERGHLGPMSVDAIRRVAAVLEVQLPFAPRWRGGELARLLDARHAGLVERVVGMVTSLGWETVVEATFNEYGERGSIDILAWHAASRTLLVIEVKTRIVDLQDLLAGMDRKSRLAGTIARRQRGWSAADVAVVLVLPAGSTSTDAVARHRSVFGVAFPARNVEVRRWLRRPVGALRGVLFVRDIHSTTRPDGSRPGSRQPRAWGQGPDRPA